MKDIFKVHEQYLKDIDECNKGNPSRRARFIADYKEKGYCAIDLWCLATSTAKFVLPRLKDFRDIVKRDKFRAQNYPPLKSFNAMIYSFQKIVDNDHMYVNEKEREKIQKGLDLFAKHLIGMWC